MQRVDEKTDSATNSTATLGIVAGSLSGLCYGAIQLTVHDGKVMQIDVTERKRLNP